MLLHTLVFAIAIGTVSITLSKGKIFRKPRLFIKQKFNWLGELLSCPYCTAHWVTFIAFVFFTPILITSEYFIFNLFTSIFCVIGLSALFIGIIIRLIPFSPDEEDNRIEELEEELAIRNERIVTLEQAVKTFLSKHGQTK